MAALGQTSLLPSERGCSVAALYPWQVGLLDALDLLEEREAFPSAVISQAGESRAVPAATECWAHLACVHFAAGMNDVAASMLGGELALDERDSCEIARTLAAHLAPLGYELHAAEEGEWRMRCPRVLLARSLPPAIAFERSLKEALPSGEDGAELRRLMTEMQMLLHEHAVNARRARAGLAAANGVWIWSVANLARTITHRMLPIGFGDDSYLKGLYFLHSQAVKAETFDVETLREAARSSRKVVALVRPGAMAALESDWLKPLYEELRSGGLAQLAVYIDRWRIELRRRDLLRFWRRPLPLSAWPV